MNLKYHIPLLSKNPFSPKLFYGQLNYFVGINYTEAIELMPGFDVDEKTVKNFLTDAALSEF